MDIGRTLRQGTLGAAFLLGSYGTVLAAPGVKPPSVFAPGVISRPGHESAPAFSPDGQTVLFGRSSDHGSTIMISHRTRQGWTSPEAAAFSGKWLDQEPTMSPDGSYVVFVSNRPAESDGKPLDGFFNGKLRPGKGGNLWRVDRRGKRWGTPVRLPELVNTSTSTFAPSVAANGNIYFMRPAADSKGRFQLFRSRFVGHEYQRPEPLPFNDGRITTVDPAVAPDESFIVFSSSFGLVHDMELFIAFQKDGAWGTPGHLEGIEAPGSDAEARLGPDRTLYFASVRIVPGISADWNDGKYNIWRVSLEPWLRRLAPIGDPPSS